MARGWPGCRAVDTLDESLVRLRGIGAALGCVGVAVELQEAQRASGTLVSRPVSVM